MDCGLIFEKGRGLSAKWWEFFWFWNYFQYENDGGLGPRFMDRWRLGPPWTTQRRRPEAPGARWHAHQSSVSNPFGYDVYHRLSPFIGAGGRWGCQWLQLLAMKVPVTRSEEEGGVYVRVKA
jgi:hypothetical protein